MTGFPPKCRNGYSLRSLARGAPAPEKGTMDAYDASPRSVPPCACSYHQGLRDALWGDDDFDEGRAFTRASCLRLGIWGDDQARAQGLAGRMAQ